MDSASKFLNRGLLSRYATPIVAALGLAVAGLLSLAAYEHQLERRDAARVVASHAIGDKALDALRRSITEQEVAIHEAIAALEAGVPTKRFERRYANARADFRTALATLRAELRPAAIATIATGYARYVATSGRVWAAVRARRRGAAARGEQVGEARFEILSDALRVHAERHEAETRSAAQAHARSEERAVGATLLAATVGVALLAALGLLLLRAERGRARAAAAASQGEAMRAVVTKFRSLIEGMPCVSYIADRGPSGRWHFVSPQIEGLLGYSADEWTADPELWLRSLHPADADWVVAYELEHWDADAVGDVTIEYRMVARDGRTVWVNDSGMPFVGPDGMPAWYGVMFDISARRAAEAELAEARAQLEQAQTLAHVGSFEYRFEAGRVRGSREFAAITGLDPAVPAWPLNHLIRLLPEDRRADALKAVKLLANGWPLEAEWELTRADGSTRCVTVIARRAADGPPRAIGTLQDVTELRAAERERSELQQALAHSQRLESVGKLAGGIAHEFNNLLTVIANSAAFLEEAGPSGGADREDLRHIRDACARAATLTRQLLAFARREMVQPEPLDLGAFVSDTAPLLERAVGERIAVVVAASDCPCVVSADPAQIQQVLLNLALNARDAMPRGGTLAIELTNDVEAPVIDAGASHEWVGLIVSDDGCGMEPGVAEHAFDPFFTTKPRATGTGLGLSMVHGIVSQFGGVVELETEPGRGTTFRIFLPATDLAGIPRLPDEPSDPAPPLPAGGAAKTVLVVDDQDSLRAVVARMLERAGFQVLAARNGRHALEVLRQNAGEVDLVLSDVVMPYLGGPELARELGEDGPPVVFMSGYIDDPAVHELVEERGIPVLRKPFTTRELLALVTRALGAPPHAAL